MQWYHSLPSNMVLAVYYREAHEGQVREVYLQKKAALHSEGF